MSIQLITFDLDDTLWETSPLIRTAVEKQNDWLNKQIPDFKERISQDELTLIRNRVTRDNPELKHDLTNLRTQVLAAALQQIGGSRDLSVNLAQQAVEVFMQARHEVTYFDHAISLLETLSANYLLGALSNGNTNISRIGLDKYFSFSYSAADLGIGKPAPDMFIAAMQHAGVTANQMVHIGDHPEHDIQAASALGIKTIWFNRTSQSTPPQTTNYREVTCLSDIPSCLSSF